MQTGYRKASHPGVTDRSGEARVRRIRAGCAERWSPSPPDLAKLPRAPVSESGSAAWQRSCDGSCLAAPDPVAALPRFRRPGLDPGSRCLRAQRLDTGRHPSATKPIPRHCEPPQAARQSMDCACRPAPTQSLSREVTPWIASSLTLLATTKAGPRVRPGVTRGGLLDSFCRYREVIGRRGSAACC